MPIEDSQKDDQISSLAKDPTPITPEEPNVQLKTSEILKIIDKNRALDATYRLIQIVLDTTEFDELTQKIADTIPAALGYQLGIILINDKEKQKLSKIAISKYAGDAQRYAKVAPLYRELGIPCGYEDNVSIRSMREKSQFVTPYLWEVFKPTLTKEEATQIQETLGTAAIIITPLFAHEKVIGVLIVGLPKTMDQVNDFEKEMLRKFSQNAGIAIENSRLFSNLKLAKDELHKAYENLQVLNTLKDDFLSVASHELRTPMTIVKSYLWMLEQQKAGKLNEKQVEYLQKAANGTQRMIDLINDMLDISRFEQKKVTFNVVQLDMVEVAKDVLNSFEIRVKQKGITAKMYKEYAPIYVDFDDQKLKEILTNLCENAFKFTSEGGFVIGIDEAKDFTKVWVQDTGSGIEKKDLQKLFHKFGRIDNSYTIATEVGGTGLGLYIVKLYTEGMGGEVGATSDGVGKGSTFWFTIPKGKIVKSNVGVSLQQVKVPIQNSGTV